MVAQLQGLLIRRALLGACAFVAACATPPPKAPSDPVPPITAPPKPVLMPAQPPRTAPGFGPDILLPPQDAPDAEVARVGDLVLRQSHVYARLLSLDSRRTLSGVDMLVFDVLVARHAEQFGIRVQPERVEQLAAAEEEQIRKQVAEAGPNIKFGWYLWTVFGMREADWQQTLRTRTAQRLYHGYVLRYLALREDRVHVRYLVQQDEKIAREVTDKVRAGADFATLALRHSEDPSRRDGGLMPPFGRTFEHPIAATAFSLQAGQVSEPFRARYIGTDERWFVVYCLERTPGRDVPFSAVAAEIDEDLVKRPLSPLEVSNYTLRWRGELERETQQQAPQPQPAPPQQPGAGK